MVSRPGKKRLENSAEYLLFIINECLCALQFLILWESVYLNRRLMHVLIISWNSQICINKSLQFWFGKIVVCVVDKR